MPILHLEEAYNKSFILQKNEFPIFCIGHTGNYLREVITDPLPQITPK